MNKQKLLYYLFKWLAFIFLVYLILKEDHSKIPMFILIGLITIILIWEGIRDFRTKSDQNA